jgi:uncharacterized protein (TIGR03000 family)
MVGSLALLMFVADFAQAQMIARARERRTERRDMRRGVVQTNANATTTMTTQPGTVVVPAEANVYSRLSYYPSDGLANTAQIRVIVPDAQARLMFDETATKQVGVDRLFTTPTLNPSGPNTYLIRATFVQNGKEVVQQRSVTVMPGRTYVLDFTRR